MTSRRVLFPLIVLLAVAAAAAAQTRGTGRLAGKITDQDGKPIEGVRVVATRAGDEKPAFDTKTNRRGEWVIGGVAAAHWNLDFSKEGFETKSISVPVGEGANVRGIDVAMTASKPVVDPTVQIRERLQEAAKRMEAKEFAAARAIYEAVLAEYPEAHQIHPLIARTYAAEDKPDKAIEHLRLALEKDPENVEVKLLLGNTLIQSGREEEGRQILASVDISKVTDPVALINSAITLMNQGKSAEAKAVLDRVIEQLPDQADAYYYRGVAHLQLAKSAEAKADLEKFVALAKPDAPELPQAKKILEQLQ